jgi:hypothetical protein
VPLITDISDDRIDRLVTDIDKSGIGVLENFLRPDELQALQAFVEGEVEKSGGEYTSLSETQISPTLLGSISNAPAFQAMMRRVYEKGARKPAPKQSLYRVLRCLKGRTGMQHSYLFHYDSYFVTALLPIIIPTEGEAGHLIIHPRRRGVRSTYVRNLVDKVILDNKYTQARLKKNFLSGKSELREVALVPGNLYFFWGYKTIHANAPCDPKNIRATALMHFGDPHTDSALRKFTGRAKIRATTVATEPAQLSPAN